MSRANIPRHGIPVTTARHVARDTTIGRRASIKTEVVVIGSGAGGSVVAHELAKAGHQVLVLESGRYMPSAAFTEHLGDTMTQIYRDQAGQVNSTADVLFVEGECIGGSTVIGACVMHRPPDSMLQGWVDKYGLTAMAPDKIGPLFDETGREQFIHTNQSHEINSTAHKVIQGCEKMGIGWSPVVRNVRQCALTGHCLAGCPSDRKMSALVTHLPWAVGHGARIFADTHVDRVRISNGRATGVDARVIDPDNREVISDLRIDAQVVVVAGGGIHSPMLLQRSQVPDVSDQLGKNLAVQPFAQAIGVYEEEVFGFRGALVGVQIDEFLESDGYLFFSALAEPEQLMAQSDHGVGDDHINFMKKYKHMAGLNAFAIDEGKGSVEWKGGLVDGRKVISWNPTREDFNRLKQAVSIASRVFFSSGAQEVHLPTFRRLQANSVFELDNILDKANYGVRGMYSFRVNSFSPHGTCRMGLDRYTSVTNQDGEVHGVAGLFVADASLFPEPMPAAPHWMTQAMAKHVARRINQRSESLFI